MAVNSAEDPDAFGLRMRNGQFFGDGLGEPGTLGVSLARFYVREDRRHALETLNSLRPTVLANQK